MPRICMLVPAIRHFPVVSSMVLQIQSRFPKDIMTLKSVRIFGHIEVHPSESDW